MDIPGQPAYKIAVTTDSGEANGSKAQNIVGGEIKPSRGPEISLNASHMWHSEKSPNGWASVQLEFPMPVRFDRMAVHSQHSGQYHAAHAVRIQAMTGENYRDVVTRQLRGPDDSVSFRPTETQKWKVYFECGSSGIVVVRGLQFFSGKTEIFPPLVPYAAESP
jgi:hypothetical protein